MNIQWHAVTAVCVVLSMIGGLAAIYIRRAIRDEIDSLLIRLNGIYVRSALCEAYRATESANSLAAKASQVAAEVAARAAEAAQALVEEAALVRTAHARHVLAEEAEAAVARHHLYSDDIKRHENT